MARTADPEIPKDEALFRGVKPEWVTPEGDVTIYAVDLPASSFNRAKYSDAKAVLKPERPEHTSIVCARCVDLPPPVPRADAAPHECFGADDPCPKEDPENEAHAEVRVRRLGSAYAPNYKVPSSSKLKVKEALAKMMRPHVDPIHAPCACTGSSASEPASPPA